MKKEENREESKEDNFEPINSEKNPHRLGWITNICNIWSSWRLGSFSSN